MNFKRILYFGFGIILFVMALIFAVVINILNNQNEQMNDLVKDRYEKIQIANKVRAELNSIEEELDLLILNPVGNAVRVNENIERSYQTVNESIRLLKGFVNTDEGKYLTGNLEESYYEYRDIIKNINLQVTNGNLELIDQWMLHSEDQKRQLQFNVEELIALQEDIMEETLVTSEETFQSVVQYIVVFTIIGILLGIGMAFWVIRSISGRLNRVKGVMSQLAYGSNVFPKIETISNDEIGEIATAYNEMAHALEEHVRFEQEYQEDIEQQNWLKTKLTELSVMTQGNLNLTALGDLYIKKLSEFAGASHGAFYIKKSTGESEFLSFLAGYAYSNKEIINKDTFGFGEGLVGQCAKDNQVIYVNDVPDNYIQISSGLGNTPPKNLILLPVEFEEEVIGVIELAALKPFSPQQLSLLEQASAHLGVIINRISRHMQVQELLRESQTLNEELQTQSEELQLQQEELKTMNDELEAQYKNSEVKTKELEQVKLELEEKTKEILLSSKYKSEFMANMSHELRTPLNSLLILAQMLKENQEGNLNDTQVEYATTIFSSGNDLLNLINDILDLSKIESGKMDIIQGEVLLNDVIKNAERQFMPIANKKGIEFSLSVNEELPSIVFTDEQKLSQILKNLLSNAFKFTEQGKVQFHIGWENIKSDSGHTDKYLAFHVNDTGIGIPNEKVSVIFEAFRQADGTTSRRYGGTGLGLSICKELANLLGGFIKVNSEVDKGSTFTLYLPLSTEIKPMQNLLCENDVTVDSREEKEISQEYNLQKSNEENSSMYTDKPLKSKKVLIVDDDMRNIFALTSALEAEKMEVVFSENGKEAIECLSEQKDIDLILMDIMMPEMDGYEAMRHIRQMSDFKSLPIIALTAKAMKDDRQKCIDAGASDYISKPVNLEQLKSLIRVWIYTNNSK